MTEAEVRDLITHLRRVRADLTHVEAKLAESELPKRLWQSISAFSNTRDGGTLILGIAEEDDFRIAGVKNPNKIQQELASLCSSMEPAIRAHIEIHHIDGKTVVTAQIPELLSASKPCYHRSAGRQAYGFRNFQNYRLRVRVMCS